MILARLIRIAVELAGFAGWWALLRLHLVSADLTPAQRLSRSLQRLGTTFVKLGQALSLRRDLFPDDYVRVLQRLQDHVRPFPAPRAVCEIEEAFGRTVAELFAEFDEWQLQHRYMQVEAMTELTAPAADDEPDQIPPRAA